MGWDELTVWTRAFVSGVAGDRRVPGPPQMRLFERARSAVADGLSWPDAPVGTEHIWRRRIAPEWHRWAPVIGRYLAARAHASWACFLGRDLSDVRQAVDVARAVVQVEAARCCARAGAGLDRGRLTTAIRQSDLLLVHYTDPQRLYAGRHPVS